MIINSMTAGGGGGDFTIDTGTCERANPSAIQAGSYLEMPFNFNKTFTSAPNVIANLYATRASSNTYFWKATVSVTGISTTGATVVVGNPTSSNFNSELYHAMWVAIGN